MRIMQFRIIEAGPCQGEAKRATLAPVKTAQAVVTLGSQSGLPTWALVRREDRWI
jgi:hypothetical protein